MLRARNKTGLVFFPAFDWAISPTHPEREERLLYTQDQVFEEGILDIEGIIEYKPDLVTKKDVQRVHFCVPDLWAVMTESHFISAGGAKTIAMAVMDKKVKRGFALVRPPGHHANAGGTRCPGVLQRQHRSHHDRISSARPTRSKRVAIVDTDCHHGDGTQDIYWHDPDTLFHLHPPGRPHPLPRLGFLSELGGPNAVGTTINIPCRPIPPRRGFLHAIREVVLPILDEFSLKS
jgi:acetoin utilization deacetylase AcuC-like enzyme